MAKGTTKMEVVKAEPAPLMKSGVPFGLSQATAPDEMPSTLRTALMHTLQPNEQIAGVYIGSGGDVLVNDQSGKVDENGDPVQTPVPTHLIECGPVTWRLMGAHQLDEALPKLPIGSEVVVQHLGKKTKGPRQINQYAIWTPRNPSA